MTSPTLTEKLTRGLGRTGPLVFVWAITVMGLGVTASWLQLRYDDGHSEQTDIEPSDPISNENKATFAQGQSGLENRVERNPGPPTRFDEASEEKADPAQIRGDNGRDRGQNTIDRQLTEKPQNKVGNGAIIRLAPAPDPTLVEETPLGPLPAISDDGRYPWRVYARPYLGDGTAKRIAIVMQEIGISESASRMAITQLPADVTLAISPYAHEPQAVANAARRAGHEVLLMVPMEPVAYPENDPGPQTLLTRLSHQDNMVRLHQVMSRFHGYTGLVNHMGSRFTATQNPLVPILEEVDARGLLFVDARSSAKSLVGALAGEIGLPYVENDRFIDNRVTETEIDRYLSELESIAERQGHAVGFARPYPLTIDRIKAWLPDLAIKNIELVPISALAQ